MPEWISQPETDFPHRFLTVGRFLLLIAILATVGIFSAILGIRLAVRGTEVGVPPLTGKSVEEAKKALAGQGLAVEVTGERYDPSTLVGKVLSQLPAPGGRIKSGGSVQVVVSLGPRRVPIPDLRGASVRSARLMVTQAGYELGNVSVMTADSADREEVVTQYPSPTSKETGSPKIDILVTTPPKHLYVMPDVTGQNITGVLAFFEKHGLKVKPPEYRSYQNVEKGAVVKQYPEPGYPLSDRDAISLEVAR